MQQQKPTPAEILRARRYDPNKAPEPEQVIFTIGDKKVGSLQNLVTITGKQKNGKSRYVSATIAAAITSREIFTIRLRQPPGRNRIALFDTEQSDYDFYKQMQQIRAFTELAELPDTLDAFNTREDDPAEILKMIDHYLEATPECGIIFVDGILDLLIDFNNVTESKFLTNHIKRITKQRNCLFVGVMHRGKGNDLTVGNLGSMADRLAQSVLKVEKNKERGTFALTADWMRSDEDFHPVEIFYNNGRWEQIFSMPADENAAPVRPIRRRPAEYEIDEHQEYLPAITPELFTPYKALVQNIQEVYGVGRNWAVECVSHLQSEGLIFKHPQGYSTRSQTEARLFIKS